MDSEGIINSLKNIELNSSNHLFIQSLNGVLMDKKEINDEVYNLCTLLESNIQFNNKEKILENDCIFLITIPVITSHGEKSFNQEIGSLESTQDLLIDLEHAGNLLSVFKVK
jgi:hypothetical protein